MIIFRDIFAESLSPVTGHHTHVAVTANLSRTSVQRAGNRFPSLVKTVLRILMAGRKES